MTARALMQLPSFITMRQSANSGMWFCIPHNSEDEAIQKHQQDRRPNSGFKASTMCVLVETVGTGALNYEVMHKWERE